MRQLREGTVRLTIGMIRSIASNKPISLFHLEAAKEMEQLLEEVLEYRKEKKDEHKPIHTRSNTRTRCD